jgi:hypothetical protein
MRRLLSAVSLAVFALSLVLSATWAGPSGPERYVTLQVAPKADVAALQTALASNAFQPLGPITGAGELRGRLPEAATANVLKLPGVDRLILGPRVVSPPPVQAYDVRLRFSINLEIPRPPQKPVKPAEPPKPSDPPRVDWRRRKELYDEMTAQLKASKFQHQPKFEEEWKYSDLLFGVVPALGADGVVTAPQVRTTILLPQGYDAAGRKTLLLQMRLTTGFGILPQHEVAKRARALLEPLGFQEAVAYDPEGNTRLLGWLPADKLDALLGENMVMEVPLTGLEPPVQGALTKFRVQPIRRVEVLRDPVADAPADPETAAVPRDQEHLEKVSVDLRRLLGQGGKFRVEVILRTDPPVSNRVLAQRVQEVAKSFEMEGRIGPLVGGIVDAADVAELARSPQVSTVRLPQPALTPALPPMDAKGREQANFDFVSLFRPTLGVRELGALIRRKPSIRVAVISSDFRGAQKLIEVRLPPQTHVLDFTPSRDKDLQPDALAGNADEIGHGTRLALAVVEATPVDELFLLRVSPDAPFQVQDILERLEGGPWRSEALLLREREIRADRIKMDTEKSALRFERNVLIKTFREDDEYRKARDAYLAKEADAKRREQLLLARTDRLVRQHEMGQKLQGVGTVVVGLDWPDGQPRLPEERGGLRYLRGGPNLSAAWVQAMPKLPRQSWTGLFRDGDGDNVMDFAPRDRAVAGRHDLNYLLWQPHPWLQGAATNLYYDHLPGKTVVRLTLQWREAHAPEWKQPDSDDYYRQAISPFRIVVLKQRDPTGQLLPVDTFEVVARSQGWADRVEDHPRYGIYQHTVRFDVPVEGRYAIRIEGKQPDSTLPVGVVRSGRLEKFELYPQLKVDVLSPATRDQGRVVLQQGE